MNENNEFIFDESIPITEQEFNFLNLPYRCSVTERAKTAQQPKGGFLPKSAFLMMKVGSDPSLGDRSNRIIEIPTEYASMVGTITDYLTRMYITKDKETAFKTSLIGAMLINKSEFAKELLDEINFLGSNTVINAIKLTGFDRIIKNGFPDYQEPPIPPVKVIYDIVDLVYRCIDFFSVRNITETGFAVNGGKETLVSFGEGDYLSKTELIDLKVSKTIFSSAWSLQVLMYYIMGLHNNELKFNSIDYIGIYNALKNEFYRISIKDIPDEIMYQVSSDVLGYKMLSSEFSDWKNVSDENNDAAFKEQVKRYNKTAFDPDNFTDGIHDITNDDYWTYLCNTEYKRYSWTPRRPKFTNIKSIKFIKKGSYHMFIAELYSGKSSILNGCSFSKSNFPIAYYYNNLELYAENVKKFLAPYTKAQESISQFIKKLVPEEGYDHHDPFWYVNRGGSYGEIHGAIIDIDALNHIFLNPIDGTILPYYADSMVQKWRYKNVISLLADKRSEYLPSFKKEVLCLGVSTKADTDNSLEIMSKNPLAIPDQAFNILTSMDIETEPEYMPEYTLYSFSKVILKLQKVLQYNLVVAWYDSFIKTGKLLLSDFKNVSQSQKRKTGKDYIGESKVLKNGMRATITEYYLYKDITIEFEDGTIKKHCSIAGWRSGCISHPKIKANKKISKSDNGINPAKTKPTPKCKNITETKPTPRFLSDDDMIKRATEGYFVRNINKNIVYCPGGNILKKKRIRDNGSIAYINKSACRKCPYIELCCNGKTKYKEVQFAPGIVEKTYDKWMKHLKTE